MNFVAPGQLPPLYLQPVSKSLLLPTDGGAEPTELPAEPAAKMRPGSGSYDQSGSEQPIVDSALSVVRALFAEPVRTMAAIAPLPHERPRWVRAPGEPVLPEPRYGMDYVSRDGLRPNTRHLLDLAHQNGLGLTNGTQTASVPDHPAGRAIDVSNAHHPTPRMREYAEQMRQRALHGNPDNIRIIIYDNRWAISPDFSWQPIVIPPGGWSGNPVSDRHENHVHIATF